MFDELSNFVVGEEKCSKNFLDVCLIHQILIISIYMNLL